MMRRITMSGLVITGLFLSLSANAALFGVLPATPMGNDWLAYYDDQLDITWLADANSNGQDTWDNQTAWATGLMIDGVSGWRLPNMDIDGNATVVDCSSGTQAACKDNEYGHLFFYGAGTTLDNGVTPTSPDPFSDLQASNYWSSTEFNTGNRYNFRFLNGTQFGLSEGSNLFAWAVHDGNAAAVPVPPAVWLFGSALGLLGWMRRKKAS